MSASGEGGASEGAEEPAPEEHGCAVFGAEGVIIRALPEVQGCPQGAGGWGLLCHMTCM